MRLIYCLIASILFTSSVYAQDIKVNGKSVTKSEADTSEKHKKVLQVGTGGITVTKDSSTLLGDDVEDKSNEKFSVHWGMLDLGFNKLQDNTNYNSPAAQSFLNVPTNQKNSNLFNLNQGKSVNVNVYPIVTKYRLLKTQNQRIYLMSGLGLQLYNFRFEKAVTYSNKVNPEVYLDSNSFKKDKLAFDYLTIPLELVFKTRVGSKNWLVYGFGITEGYRLNSWMKQESSAEGKQKDHDKFNFSDFNTCLMGEIGLDGYIRLYATYQVTALQENSLDQHPFCIGIRFMGI